MELPKVAGDSTFSKNLRLELLSLPTLINSKVFYSVSYYLSSSKPSDVTLIEFPAMEEDESASQPLRYENQQESGVSLREDELLWHIQQLLVERAPLTFERLAPIESTDRIRAIETFEILLGKCLLSINPSFLRKHLFCSVLCQQRKISLKQEPCDLPPFNDIFIMLRH